jgi:hypothetical protein
MKMRNEPVENATFVTSVADGIKGHSTRTRRGVLCKVHTTDIGLLPSRWQIYGEVTESPGIAGRR